MSLFEVIVYTKKNIFKQSFNIEFCRAFVIEPKILNIYIKIVVLKTFRVKSKERRQAANLDQIKTRIINLF